MRPSRAPLLPFATITLLLLLNYPWLSLYSSNHLLGGFPPLYLYLFVLWLAFILVVRLLLRPSEEESEAEPPLSAPPSPARSHPGAPSADNASDPGSATAPPPGRSRENPRA